MSATDILRTYSNEEMAMLETRLARAKDPTTPPFVLKNLSKDSDPLVRRFVALNRGTPEGSLWELTYDPDLNVREKAFNTLGSMGLRIPGRKPPLLAKIRNAEEIANSQKGTNEPTAKKEHGAER